MSDDAILDEPPAPRSWMSLAGRLGIPRLGHLSSRSLVRSLGPAFGLALIVMGVWGRLVLTRYTSARLSNPGDSVSFEYYLGWNVHALLHAENPFFTPNMYAPTGLDLGNAISVPAVSVLLAPVTLLAGTTAAYNTGVLLAIFLASLSTYLLARELSGSTAGAFVGGALMVVNPYFTGHALSHFNLLWIFGFPLVAYLVVLHTRRRLGSALFVVLVGLTVAFTFGASTELAVTEVVFGAIAAVVVGIFAQGSVQRRALVRSAAWTVGGGVLGVVLASPVIIASLHSGVPTVPANPPALYSSDLLNMVAPTRMFLFGGSTTGPWTNDWLGNDAENTAYLPITLTVIVCVLMAARRTRLTLGLALFAMLSLLCSLGPALVVDGTPHGELPWAITAKFPGLDHALPGRFSTYAFLALCLVTAAAWPKIRARAVALTVALGLSFSLLLPDFGFANMPVHTVDRTFITSGDYRQVIRPDQVVLVLPGGQGGPGLQWVTDSDFYFRVPTGNGGGATAPPDLGTPVGRALFAQDTSFDYGHRLTRWAQSHGVRVVLVETTETYWTSVAETAFGPADTVVDNVQVWQLRSPKARRSVINQ